MPYLVRDIKGSKPTEITCGIMRELISSNDSKDMSIIYVTITDSTKKHYHKKLTEAYYILKGSLNIEIDGKIEKMSKDQIIMIFPKTNHKAWKTSKENAEILVVSSPPWSEDDEILVE